MLFRTPDLEPRELEVLNEIAGLRETMRTHLREPRRWSGSLRRVQFARGVRGSNSIEGYEAGLDDAMAIDVGEEPLDANEETALALRGYRTAMTYVLQLADEDKFHFGEQLIKSLHYMMTNYDLKSRPGRWRAGSIYVKNEETGEIVYEGPEVDRVDSLMHDLICDLEKSEETPALIKAAMAHLNLVMVHPFRDGNGRMARCVQTLALAREGIVSPVFSSIEEYLGRNTQSYYDVLAEVGQGSWHPQNDARPWVRYVLTAHLRQARTVLRRIRESERLYVELDRLVAEHGLPPRTTEAMFDAAYGLRVRRSVYKAIVENQQEDELNDQAATRDLTTLADIGLLVPHGEKRGRYYTAGPVLVDIRRRIMDARAPWDNTDPFTIEAASPIEQPPLFEQ